MRFALILTVLVASLISCNKTSDTDGSKKPIEDYYLGLVEKNSERYANAFDFEKLKFLGIDYGSEYRKAPEDQRELSKENFLSTAFRENPTRTIEEAKSNLQNLQRRVISDVEVEYSSAVLIFVVKKNKTGRWLIVEVKLSK